MSVAAARRTNAMLARGIACTVRLQRRESRNATHMYINGRERESHIGGIGTFNAHEHECVDLILALKLACVDPQIL